MGTPGPRRRLFVNRTGIESLLELPKNIQRQALRKMETIGASPESAGYPLRKPLQGFRGIHSGRYRIVWRLLTLEEGELAFVAVVDEVYRLMPVVLTASTAGSRAYCLAQVVA
jgi:mRNA-degrading endonuclease RelE of RelBE toxin-antitoxin system